MFNNSIINVDTDAILICKPDQSSWTEEEQLKFLELLNLEFPDKIKFEHDGYYKKVIVLKAKNYILYDPTKEKEKDRKQVKGSAFKSAKKEPIVSRMMQDMIDALLNDKQDSLVDIYESYVQRAINVDDISLWASKVTITEAVLKCVGYEAFTKEELKEKGIRANETTVWEAVKNEELVQQGDKFYVFPAILNKKELVSTKTLKSGKEKTTIKTEIVYGLLQPKDWNGSNHDVQHLLLRLYKTMEIFANILDLTPFKNYALMKNYKELINKE